MRSSACCLLFALALAAPLQSQMKQLPNPDGSPREASPDLQMMESTFRLVQLRQSAGQGSLGTAFLLSTGSGGQSEIVAVTAKHVLEAMTGDYATLELRARDPSGATVLIPCVVRIRKQGRRLYIVHASADVAAFQFTPPSFLSPERLASADWLASNESVSTAALQPADRINALGFPLGVAANRAGYPILRTGAIASYPILPFGMVDLLADIPALEGNSGGPVYLPRGPNGQGSGRAQRHLLILGLVAGSLNSLLTPTPEALGISIVVPAPDIRETLNSLPHPATPLTCTADR